MTRAAGARRPSRLAALRRGLTLIAIAAGYGLWWLVARRARARILARMLERMGPTFIKVGQIMSSRPDLIAPETARALARLRDRGATVPADHILHTIERSLAAPIDERFQHFEPVAVATGSIAQVHRAVLRDGRRVAVKVIKPGIAAQIAADFAFLALMARNLERLPGFRAVPIVDLVEEFHAAIAAQVDLAREAHNNARFRTNLARRTAVIVPRLVPALCTDSVLTMEFLDDLTPLHALALTASQRSAAAKEGLYALYQMIFDDGFAHADLHPGNVFFRAGPEVVLLDLGLVAELDRANRDAFKQSSSPWSPTMAPRARGSSARPRALPVAFCAREFDAAMAAMVDRFAGQRVREFEVARFATELFDLQRRLAVRGSTNFTMIILSLLVFEGIVRTLAPDLDFQREAARFFLPRSPVTPALREELSCHP